MNLEYWNTIAALGTFLVITASAIAALIQLRHIRRSNQLPGLLSVLELFQQKNVHELINFVRRDLSTRLESEDFRASLERVPIDRAEHPELHLCEMYEEVGSYVRNGLIDEDLFLSLTGTTFCYIGASCNRSSQSADACDRSSLRTSSI
jgi:hypothetical protein